MKIGVFIVVVLVSCNVNAISLQSNTSLANAGYYQISWDAAEHETVVLEESLNQHFFPAREIYRGKDTSTAMSGKSDGTYYYRVKNQNATHWSETIAVTVEHHSLVKAFVFFILGFIVFTSTCWVIFKNHKVS